MKQIIMAFVLLSFSLLVVLQVSTSGVVVIEVNLTDGDNTPSCLNGTLPCRTLSFALKGIQNSISSSIYLSEGNHKLTIPATLTYKTSFSLIGPHSHATVVHCNDGSGFSFSYSNGIHFSGLTMSGCGMYHNSTSSPGGKYLPFQAAIYFLFCSNVYFENVTVTNSTGVGVVFYSTVGNNILEHSNFTYNTPSGIEYGGGGVSIEFVYCRPGDDKCNNVSGSIIPLNYTNGLITDAFYEISNCLFTHNIGNVISNLYISPVANDNIALGRGGGLSVVYKGNVTNIPVYINYCLFYNNTAVWGGGLLIEFQDRSMNNSIIVSNTVFEANQCPFVSCTYQGTGGGGTRVLFAGIGHHIQNNSVLFSNSNFTDNSAYFGGGASFLTFREYPNSQKHTMNAIRFENCSWHNNVARLGSAVDLTLWHLEPSDSGLLIMKPVFTNCIFDFNSIGYTSDTSTPAGIGTLYTDSVPIQFQNDTHFIGNSGSAITSLDASVEFGIDSVTEFIDNSAQVGGGIALFNKAFIMLNAHSSISFINNRAFLNGGGLYWENIGDHQLISSRNCFIRYFDSTADPSEWQIEMRFLGNNANLSGHAIYATTILGCLWGGQSHGELVDPKTDYYKVFCWSKSAWNYGPNTTCNGTNIIATSPAYFADAKDSPQCQDSYSISVIPGKESKLPLKMLDDRLKPVPSKSLVFSLHKNSTYDSVTEYITYRNVSYYGDPYQDNQAELFLKTIHPRVISTKINLQFEKCPPAFVLENNKCRGGSFPFVRLHTNFTASIEYGYWIGRTGNSENNLMVGQCFYCPQNTKLQRKSFIILPESSDELDEYFCGGLNREGVTCAQCKKNYSVAVNSEQFKCIPCSSDSIYYSWVFYLLAEYLPLTMMLIIVTVLNISVTSGPANAFIFFAQIISTTYGIDANGIIDYPSITPAASVLKQIYVSLYAFWNLSFFTALDVEDWLFCLAPNITSLHVMALKFVSAFFPLVVIGLVVLMLHLYHNNYRCIVCIIRPMHKVTARCLSWLNLQRSLMDTFATFLILSYVKFAVTSCQLLFANTLVSVTGQKKVVCWFDGNINYFSLDYAPYLVMSSFVLFLCVLFPFILLLYSIKPCYICLEKVNWKPLKPGAKTQQFLDSFHQCFKDGSNGEHDRRYYAAIYFFLKLALITTYAFGLSWPLQYVFQQFICTIALLLLGILQPYKKFWYNVLDMIMFSLLSCINVIILYNYYIQSINSPLSTTFYCILIVLIFLPLVYFTIYIAYFIIEAIKKKYCHKSYNLNESRHFDDFSFNTFMDDVNKEDRFKQINYYGSLVPDEYTPPGPPRGEEPSHNTLESRNRITTATSSFSEIEPLVQPTED